MTSRASASVQRFIKRATSPGTLAEADHWWDTALKGHYGYDGVNVVRIGPNYPDTNGALDAGLICEAYVPLGLANQIAFTTSGIIYLVRLPWRKSQLLTNVSYQINTAGSGLTSGQNFVGVYDSTGARQAVSADQTTAWAGTGWFSTAMVSPVTIAGSPTGFIWVAFLGNGTTKPALGKSGGAASISAANRGVSAANTFHGHILTGQTTLPSSITPGSIIQDVNNYYAAVS